MFSSQREQVIYFVWICIFTAIAIALISMTLRCTLIYLLKHNCCNLQTIFSNTRILQTSAEKKTRHALDASLQKTFKETNIQRILPLSPQFVSFDSGNSHLSNHCPLFQIAFNGKIEHPGLIFASKVPDYTSVTENKNVTTMLTDYYRNNMQQMESGNSLSRHANSGMSHSSFGSYSNDARVPVDRPLFVNTSMSAQQRVDIYRQLSNPPKDSEPALAFYLRNL